jgi:hypothetical protein
MRWRQKACSVRSFEAADRESLARHADNRKVRLDLRDRVPYPFREEDARQFLEKVAGEEPERIFTIAVGEAAVGSVGFQLHDDIERCTAEIAGFLRSQAP